MKSHTFIAAAIGALALAAPASAQNKAGATGPVTAEEELKVPEREPAEN